MSTHDSTPVRPDANDSALPTMAVPYEPPAAVGPQARMRTLSWTHPFRWLELGRQDLFKHPGIAFFYGLCFFLMAQVLAQKQRVAAPEPAPVAAPAPEPAMALAEAAPAVRRPGFDESEPATWGDPARNDPCPCGSGEKFKHCHGKLA